MTKQKNYKHWKYGGYTSGDFYCPSYLDMKDPYFIQLREQFFHDKNIKNKSLGVKTTYQIPISSEVVLNESTIDKTLTTLK